MGSIGSALLELGKWAAALASIGAVLFSPALWLDSRTEARFVNFERNMNSQFAALEARLGKRKDDLAEDGDSQSDPTGKVEQRTSCLDDKLED